MAEEKKPRSEGWNPWHGCTKISAGCKYCYVYRQDERYNTPAESSLCKKNKTFDYPIRRKRDGSYQMPSGSLVYTCFTSDFLLEDADEWRPDCWKMMREREDCFFLFFTKRIDRLKRCLPEDWGEGYDNVAIGCTVENQDRADFRLPIFMRTPIRHKYIIVAPMLEAVDLTPYLNETIEEVSVGGESGSGARPCHFDWVLDVRRQCMEKGVSFRFHQTGAKFVKDGKTFEIPRKFQIVQAKKADIDFGIGTFWVPDPEENEQLKFFD